MARNSNLNTNSKSSGNNPTSPDQNSKSSSLPNLTEEQKAAVKDIEDEIKLYMSELSRTTDRQDQIIDILDNLDDVWEGRIPVDELPDPLSSEIINDKIINVSEDIIKELGFDDINGSLGNYSDSNKKSRAAQIAINALNTDYSKEIRERANSYGENLNHREMYKTILLGEIYKVIPTSGNAADSSNRQIENAREKLVDLITNA